MPTPYTDQLWLGTAWYPELWPHQVNEDLRLMRELGLNCVRLGDSIWSVIEPRDGHFDLDWFEDVLDKIHAAGLRFILCTPTYTPPRWVSRDYPEAIRVDRDGLRFGHGGRGHGSHASPAFRRLATRIARTMARKWGNHPGLLAWQIDNEVLCHVDGDFGAPAIAAWHAWLERKFKTVDELNRRWATRVWDQHYERFADVPAPGKNPYGNTPGTATGEHNPSLMVAWGEFISDNTVEFVRLQAEAIRRHSDAPITHNHIQLERTCPDDLFRHLDFCATDSYWWPGTAHNHLRSIAWMRGLKRKPNGTPLPCWLMETAPYQLGGLYPTPIKPPGYLRAEAALLFGAGCTAELYWLWRQQRTGVESSHGCILNAWGTPTPGWNEVKSVSEFLAKARPLLADIPPATPDIALHDPKLSKQLLLRGSAMYPNADAQWTYRREVDEPLIAGGWWHDLIPESADPAPYKVVLSPWMPILPETVIARMLPWVERGGTWVIGPMSSLRDECAAVFTSRGLGRLEEVMGFRTLFWQQVGDARASLGRKILKLDGLGYALDPGLCTALGKYQTSYAAGHCWALETKLGAGRIVLFAAFPPGGYGQLLEATLGKMPLRRMRTSSPGNFLLPRATPDGSRRGYVAGNTDGKRGWVQLPEDSRDLLTGKKFAAGTIRLQPFEVLALLSA